MVEGGTDVLRRPVALAKPTRLAQGPVTFQSTQADLSLGGQSGPVRPATAMRREILTRSVSEEIGCGPRSRFGLV
jgi:hypothetical protein